MTGVEATGEVGVEEGDPPSFPTLRYFRRYLIMALKDGCHQPGGGMGWEDLSRACVDTALAEPFQLIIISTELCLPSAPQSTEF